MIREITPEGYAQGLRLGITDPTGGTLSVQVHDGIAGIGVWERGSASVMSIPLSRADRRAIIEALEALDDLPDSSVFG